MIDDIGSLRIKCINLESEILVLKKELAESEAEVERLNSLLSDLLFLTEKNYCNSTNYNQIKKAHHAHK